MEYLFTCKKCGCHSYYGPIRLFGTQPTIACVYCFLGEEASDEFLKLIKWDSLALK